MSKKAPLTISTRDINVEVELTENVKTPSNTPDLLKSAQALTTPTPLRSLLFSPASKGGKRMTRTINDTIKNAHKPMRGSKPVTKSPSLVGSRLWGHSESQQTEEVVHDEGRTGILCIKSIIHPESKFRTQWNFASLLIVLYCCIDIPVDIGFYPTIEVNFGFVINCIFDLFFVVDIVINFNTGYDYHGVVVMEKRKVRDYYLRNGFLIDFIASVPVDYFSFFGGSSSITKASRLVRVLRIFRLLRLLRLPRLFRYSRRFTDRIHSGYLRVIKLIFLLLLFAHWNACLLFLVSSLETTGSTTWISQMEEEHDLDSVSAQYTWSLFNGLSHMLCIGYGVFPPSTTGEVWATIFSMSIGASLFACIVGSITAVLLSLDSASANFQTYMNEANAYFAHRQVPTDLRKKVKAYLSMRWSQRHGERMQYIDEGEFIKSSGIKMYDENKILNNLSPVLRKEVRYDAVRYMLNKNPVFADSFFPEQLSVMMSGFLEESLFLEGQKMIVEGEIPTSLYFVRRGRVTVLKFDKQFGAHGEGSYVGELPFLYPTTVPMQPCDYVAESIAVEAYSLSAASFESVCGFFPDLLDVMKLVAKQRVEKLRLAQYIPLEVDDERHVANVEKREKLQTERMQQLEKLFQERQKRDMSPEAKKGGGFGEELEMGGGRVFRVNTVTRSTDTPGIDSKGEEDEK